MTDLLTLDVGTTALKAVLFDEQGHLRARAECEYNLDKPRPGWIELEPEQYWEAACGVVRSVLADCRGRPPDIGAISVTSQGETMIILDKSGKPLCPAIVWLDTRSDKEALELAREIDLESAYRITGQQEILPAWPAVRIMWLRRHQPEIFRRAAAYLMAGDYLLYRLTGALVSDRGLNPSSFYYDLNTGKWWPEMLERLGISAAQLPELIGPGGLAGKTTPVAADMTGLRAGIPVVSAPIDQVCGAIGAGNIAAGMITENTGAALALAATTATPVFDPHRRLGVYAHGVPECYMLLPWAPTAGMILRWFRDELGAGLDYDGICAAAAAVPAGADGLLLLPHFSGAGCPSVNPAARGVFWGLTLNHTRAHIARAVLESVAFMLRGNLDMLADMGVTSPELRSLGGASRGQLWLQIKADVCRRDLLTMECAESTSLGAALLAAVTVGMYPDHQSAAAAMVRSKNIVRHNPAMSDEYETVYRNYQELESVAFKLYQNMNDRYSGK